MPPGVEVVGLFCSSRKRVWRACFGLDRLSAPCTDKTEMRGTREGVAAPGEGGQGLHFLEEICMVLLTWS